MSPLREFRAWTTRYEEEIIIEPLRRYYLIFEGANTERKYFQGIEDYRKELRINSYIELVILHKEGEIRSFSHPSKLLELIDEKKKSLKRDAKFDKEIDCWKFDISEFILYLIVYGVSYPITKNC